MKRLTIFLVAMAISFHCLAQDVSSDSDYTYGLGINMDSSGSGLRIYIPVKSNRSITTEPIIQRIVETGSTDSYDDSREFLMIGVGIFYSLAKHQQTAIYFGGRIGFFSYSSKLDYENNSYDWDYKTKYTGIILSPIVGAEYFFSDFFSISGEICPEYQESYSGTSTYTKPGSADIEEDYSVSQTKTQTAIILRWYF